MRPRCCACDYPPGPVAWFTWAGRRAAPFVLSLRTSPLADKLPLCRVNAAGGSGEAPTTALAGTRAAHTGTAAAGKRFLSTRHISLNAQHGENMAMEPVGSCPADDRRCGADAAAGECRRTHGGSGAGGTPGPAEPARAAAARRG